MNIFRKKRNHTSDDYYDSYKAGLGIEDRTEGILSLSTVVKIETVTIIAGIIFMGYSNFFSDFSKNFSIEFNPNALMSQFKSSEDDTVELSDSSLVVQLQDVEPDTIVPVEISEEEKATKEPVEMFAKKLDMKFADLSLIVEIIKSEMTPKHTSHNEDSIIIGQL